jgi:hypothetical protein
MFIDQNLTIYVDTKDAGTLEVGPADKMTLDPAGVELEIADRNERMFLPWGQIIRLRQPVDSSSYDAYYPSNDPRAADDRQRSQGIREEVSKRRAEQREDAAERVDERADKAADKSGDSKPSGRKPAAS